MPSGQYTCRVCESDPFIAPADNIGAALMEAHFQDKHPVQYQEYLEYRKRSSSEGSTGKRS